jgi:5-methylcytosine-specific restriction endonuclease McrA
MGQRLYLVDVKAAEAARDRQLHEADKKRRRQWAIDQAKQVKKGLPKLPKKPKAKRAKEPKNYRRAIIPYRPGLGSKFYDTQEWQILRYKAYKLYGKTCHCCGATNTELHVDHIKPRSKYPHLELDLNNLQILCRECNLGKGNTDSIDWRTSGTIAQSA